MNFTQEDKQQIKEKGLTEEKVLKQLEIFRRGNIAVNILAAATAGKGIQQVTENQKKELIQFYEDKKSQLEILKFVPASGAATRMFKDLHTFLADFHPENETLSEYLSRAENKNLNRFFSELNKLPFYEKAFSIAREAQPGFDSFSEDAKKYELVRTMLFSSGLNLNEIPKGLVPFHNYGNYAATAFEEHLIETAKYAEVNGLVKLHFTVSEGDKEKFEVEFDEIINRIKKQIKVDFEITYSYQNPETDTLAANEDFKPFRMDDGAMFFRPGGHGALIDNLNQLSADLIFIKNIDNVVVDSKLEEIAEYKKLLAGKLLELQEKIFFFLKELEEGNASKEVTSEIVKFLKEELFLGFKTGFEELSEEEKRTYLIDKLNRPLRVCGMVKNEGEPGGGPFLVAMENGESSLQIIESSQIDSNNPQQVEIAQNATHFNPVDIVCGIRDRHGRSFDLNNYVDPETSFIASKTKEGRPLKALELPGLWNGGMAYWNTVFVEVPVSTFNPVKTVSDLLKPSHQVK